MSPKRRLGRARAFVLLALVAGCGTVARRPRVGPAPALATLMAALERRQEALRSLELETRTTSWLGGERVRATVTMLVDRPGRLRFEAEAPLQGPLASLVVADDRFALLDLEEKVFRHGRACPENVASLVRIPLTPQEIAAILLGDVPLGQGARAVDVTWDAERGADVLVIERPVKGEAATRLWVTMRSATAGAYDVLALEGQGLHDSRRWRVSYEELDHRGLVSLPTVIRYAEPGKSFDDGVEIKVRRRLGMNEPLREQAFVLEAPPGYPVERLACPGDPRGP